MIVAFTGHRPSKIGGYDPNNPIRARVKRLLFFKLAKYQVLYPEQLQVISGGALGVDQDVADICVQLGIKFRLYLPCNNYAAPWPEASQQHLHNLMDKACRVLYVSDKYTPSCLDKRNRKMVDDCDELVAIWDGSKSGTGNCVAYAYSVNKQVEIYDPNQDYNK